ncbi:MAG: MBL fold metallo-hydrolase [Deltaproteobacteria bacterium]|nr:MAG: MBL fold metallo-hydrolase [Deltaproteobacteria bacterium]
MTCFRRLLLVVLLGSVIPAAAENDDRFADVEIKTTGLTDSLAMLEGSGGNLVVGWGGDGIFLVDDQYAPLTKKILAAVAELADGPVRFVFNTHWHGDHTGGNENLGESGSLIFSHANVRRRLSTDQFTAVWDRTTPAAPEVALPVITFTDSLTFHLNGDEVHIFHVPHAHTDGDGVLHFTAANVIHTGDLVFYGLYPYIDVSAGGSIDGMIAGVRTVLDLCDEQTKIVPGHGPLLGREELVIYLEMLEGVRREVAEARQGGSDLATVQAGNPAAPWDEAWGQVWLTSDQFVESVYTSLDGPGH